MDTTCQNYGRMTRRALLAGAAMTPVALACRAPAAPAQQAGQPQTAVRPAKLLWEIRSGPTYEELVQKGLELFKQRFPQITVEYYQKPSNWVDKIFSLMAAGSGPDVFQAWDQNFWNFAARGAIVNVNDLLRDLKQADINDFHRWQWDGFVITNTNFRFGMPTYVNMGVLYYNRDLFRKYGQPEPKPEWNRDDYALMLKNLTRKEGDRQLWGGRIPVTSWLRINPHAWAYGGTFVDPKDITKSALHTPATQAGLQWIWDRLWVDNSMVQIPQQQGWSSFIEGLAQHHIATAEDGMHALQSVATQVTSEWDIAHIPRGPARRASWGTTDGWGLWNGSKYLPEAWELVKFITGPDFLKLQSRIELLIPPRASLIEDWMRVVRERFPVLEKVNLKVVPEALSATNYLGVAENFPCYQETIGDIINPALVEIFRDGRQKPAIFRDLREQIDRAATACGATFK